MSASVRQSPTASPRRKWTASSGVPKSKGSTGNLIPPGALRPAQEQPLSLGSPFASVPQKTLSPSSSALLQDAGRGSSANNHSHSHSRKLLRRHSMSPTVAGSAANFQSTTRRRYRLKAHVFVLCIALAAICSAAMFLVLARLPGLGEEAESAADTQGSLSEGRQAREGRELPDGGAHEGAGRKVRGSSTVEQRVAMLEEQQRQLELRQRQKEEEDKKRKLRLEQQQQRLQQLLSSVPDHKGAQQKGRREREEKGGNREREEKSGRGSSGAKPQDRAGRGGGGEKQRAVEGKQGVSRKEEPKRVEQRAGGQGHGSPSRTGKGGNVRESVRQETSSKGSVKVRDVRQRKEGGAEEGRQHSGAEHSSQTVVKKQSSVGQGRAVDRHVRGSRDPVHNVKGSEQDSQKRRDQGGGAHGGSGEQHSKERGRVQKGQGEREHSAQATSASSGSGSGSGSQQKQGRGQGSADQAWVERDAHLKQKAVERAKRSVRREMEQNKEDRRKGRGTERDQGAEHGRAGAGGSSGAARSRSRTGDGESIGKGKRVEHSKRVDLHARSHGSGGKRGSSRRLLVEERLLPSKDASSSRHAS